MKKQILHSSIFILHSSFILFPLHLLNHPRHLVTRYHLHHLAGLVKLFQEAVHFLDTGAATLAIHSLACQRTATALRMFSSTAASLLLRRAVCIL